MTRGARLVTHDPDQGTHGNGVRRSDNGQSKKGRAMIRASVALGAAFIVGACMADAPRPAPGAEVYDSLCAACHGSSGRGDGALAGDLPMAPADLTGLTARNGGAFPRDAVIAQVYGYPGRYHTRIMPDFGPLFTGTHVTVTTADGERVDTPRALVDLVAYIETLQH